MKIISLILSFIMTLLGFAPAVQPVDAYTQAEWYALVVREFNLTYSLDDDSNYDIAEDDEYFEVVQACHDWKVLVGEYDADAQITNVLVAKSLAVAAGLDGAELPDDKALDVAIDAGIVTISFSFFGKVKEKVMSKEESNVALKAAGLAYLNNKKDVENKGYIETKSGDELALNSLALAPNSNGFDLQTADGDVIAENEISYLSYEAKVNPFAQPETAGINQQSILDDISVSFSIGDLDVSAGIKDGGFDIALGGNVNGVYVEKAYEVRNFNLYSAFEGAIDENDIDKSYILLDYDVKDITEITGHYDWALDEIELPEGTNDVDFFTRVKKNMFEMKEGSDHEITVFSVDVAIPNCPAITIGITAKFVISFDGRVELVVTSTETKGIEITDNRVRLISESVSHGSELEMEARVEAVLGLYVDLSIVNIVLVDVGIEVGLGVHVTVNMTGGADTYTLEIPYDFLFDINFNIPNGDVMTFKANMKVYGIVTISVGENSPILDKLGLSKTWSICNEENSTFIDETITLKKAA